MSNDRDILVVKSNFHSDIEVNDLIETYHARHGDDVDILCINIDDPDLSEVYWASRKDRIVVEFEKVNPTAVIPSYKKSGDVSFNLTCTDIQYDNETDQYVYYTGLKIKNKPNGVYAYIKPSNSTNDCYISEYLGFGESDYNGEIVVMFKNRTAWPVREMLAEWSLMKEVTENEEIDKDIPTGETIDKLKNKHNCDIVELNPMDYKPFNIGEEFAEVVFVNAPYVSVKETGKEEEAEAEEIQ